MESLPHVPPEPPVRPVLLPCLAETACPHQVCGADGHEAGLMLADHIWEAHGGPKPKARKPRAAVGRLHQVGELPDQELPAHQQPDHVRYALANLPGSDLR